jgi:hypothetical protein
MEFFSNIIFHQDFLSLSRSTASNGANSSSSVHAPKSSSRGIPALPRGSLSQSSTKIMESVYGVASELTDVCICCQGTVCSGDMKSCFTRYASPPSSSSALAAAHKKTCGGKARVHWACLQPNTRVVELERWYCLECCQVRFVVCFVYKVIFCQPYYLIYLWHCLFLPTYLLYGLPAYIPVGVF